ncbi:MAG TPA: 4-carboxymuconolactone decarboxylase [Mycobacteriales bacterium]|jgi:3-oxoadipate enol-lactonase/4-carboxymuconolactone decarboxylase|nr:4-carboxymuconolactone decarboxylase [Mycobacteriales bacterium]
MSAVPVLTGTPLGPAGPGRPLLLLGPAIGTSAATLWARCAAQLAADFEILAWDLPGHGASAPAADGYSIAELAEGVLALAGPRPFVYAGDSMGATVGLQLLLEHPDRVTAAALLCTGAKIGTTGSWQDRAALVRAEGTAAVVPLAAGTWFAPGFAEREPAVASVLLEALAGADDASYAWACEALAGFDVRDRLGEIAAPVLAVAGAEDTRTPVDGLRLIADGVRDGRLAVLDTVAHLAPAEQPRATAALVAGHLIGRGRTLEDVQAAGHAVRREVLGDAHVDRAVARTTGLDRDFQDFIEQYAWGSIWTRPGLDRRSRSMVVLTALVARGHHEELAMHLRAARTNGLTLEEITEVLLQTAIYCGVPDANTAFRIARTVFEEDTP